jgi:hypothetical protein
VAYHLRRLRLLDLIRIKITINDGSRPSRLRVLAAASYSPAKSGLQTIQSPVIETKHADHRQATRFPTTGIDQEHLAGIATYLG